MTASKRKQSPPPGLSRLPPGRHGLPREFVKQNQRDRLTAGTIAAIAEHGYEDATISQIVAAAGLSRRTFYGYFKTKEACYLAACEEVVGHLREVAREAAEDGPDWPQMVRARLSAALETFAANLDLGVLLLIAPSRAGGAVGERYRAGLERAYAELAAGAPKGTAPSRAVEVGLMGGVAALVIREIEAGGDPTDLLPDLTQLVLAPYLGPVEARAVANGGRPSAG